MTISSPGAAPRVRSPLARRFLSIGYVFVAMSGWRLDHLNLPWIGGGVLSLAAGRWLMVQDRASWSLPFYIATLLFYYGGNTIILASRLPRAMIQRYGEERAYRAYETLLALMFVNQGLGLGCMTALTGPTLPIPPAAAYVVGGALFATGLVIKVWATVVLGVDIYYYKDMFLGRPVSKFVTKGPYQIFQDPMYGVGQLHAYGYAILSRSAIGLGAAAVCHALIYVFYFAVERPFVRRVYLGGATPEHAVDLV